jgi:hypothetical protein
MRLVNGSKMIGAARRNVVVRVAREATMKSVVFDGKTVDVKL